MKGSNCMLNSNERMKFINEYMAAYESKIKLANKNGLFDEAKLFELFVIEVCNLWFKQKFTNLNVEKSNYPYVDLISEDNKLLVQVSSVQDIPTKIKKTLEKIRDSKNEKYSTISNVMFFVLSNDSIKNIKEYTGTDQIGNISFTKNDNLITTNDIITKAMSDLEFQERLYQLLKKEFENFEVTSKKFYDALEYSKNVGLKNIESLINGEYEIDRSTFINEIKKDDEQYISIQGFAGSGKSVLCKKYVENEEIVLYARAERFAEESNIDDIWHCCIRDVLEYLNGKKMIIFIDALEFIADCPKTKLELLQYLYEVTKNYENVYIVTSCRTSDKKAFIKLEAKFSIKSYEINELTNEELLKITEKYPIIKRMYNMKSYVELLKSPFYINLILNNNIDIDNINDENALREYIWKNIICMEEKATGYKLDSNEIADTIKKIVFDRAKKFLIGIHKEDLKSKILEALISEGIVIQQGEYVRLKYDIFEDIAFEYYFDRVFMECKEKYQNFYNQIEELGRCVYRRYQIWISNKLFLQSNRDKFLYTLIFSNEIPNEWRNQTEIGIAKSKYCEKFFEEYGSEILEQNMLCEFVKNINLFAFEANINNIESEVPKVELVPVGNARSSIIKFIEERALYKTDIILTDDIVKLCSDYIMQENKEDTVENSVCIIMQSYFENTIKGKEKRRYISIDEITVYLNVIYQIANISKEWLKEFFDDVIEKYLSDENDVYEKIIAWTLKHTNPILVKHMTDELCAMADAFWKNNKKSAKKDKYYRLERESNIYKYGLSENVEHYSYDYRTINSNIFLWHLFTHNFEKGFTWAIKFVNDAVEKYVENDSKDMFRIKLKFCDEGVVREYWGNNNLWLTGVNESCIPTLIGDIIYILKRFIINTLEVYKEEKELNEDFVKYIKGTIYKESNNVALLTIIEEIGLHFQNEFPGYSLDLATSIDIVHWDIQRYTLYIKSPILERLEKQIAMTVGLLGIDKRYELDTKCNINIQQYVSNAQIYFSQEIRKKCYEILDYLYSIIKNDEENARDYLQIQKMDMRDAKMTQISDNIMLLEPQITGEAEKIIELKENASNSDKELLELVKKLNCDNNQSKLPLIINVIEFILSLMKEKENSVQYQDILIHLIANAFGYQELETKMRDNFCDIWLNEIEKLFDDGVFVADINLTHILLKQLEMNLSDDLKNKLKKFILKCLLYDGYNGVIAKVSGLVKKYLYANKKLARAVFNTIIKLAEDEMNHQKYNAEYIKNNRDEEDFIFIPNMQPKLVGVEDYIRKDGKKCYENHENQIIERYLLSEEQLYINENFEMYKYDISTICYVANCGLDFEEKDFEIVIKNILLCMINVFVANYKNDTIHDIIDLYQKFEVIEMFRREIISSSGNKVIDMLFDGIDFEKFTQDTIEFYQDIFVIFLCEFFDSYIDKQRRNTCKDKIKYVEEKIISIENETVRVQLYKSLILSVRRNYCWDLKKCKTTYSYADKQFLNEQFEKYGKYHMKELFATIYQLNLDELLPDILVSVSECFKCAVIENQNFKKILIENDLIINMLILKPFIKYSDEIKQNEELTNAYEEMLEILIELNYEKAAVILDEFRIH